MLANSVAGGDVRRLASIDSVLSPSSTSVSGSASFSSGPLRALLSFRLSDLLFLSLGCCALLVSVGQQGEWRLQRHAVISHTVVPFPSTSSADSSVPLTSSLGSLSASLPPLPQPIVADLDGNNRNGQSAIDFQLAGTTPCSTPMIPPSADIHSLPGAAVRCVLVRVGGVQ